MKNKKFIALTVTAALLLSPIAFTISAPALNLKVDAVSAASEEAPAATTTYKPKPTAKPTPKPTAKPTAKPVVKPTVKPTAKPVVKPVVKPTAKPVVKPTVKPVATAKPVTVKASVYQDGVFVAYGNAYSKGTEGAKVTIKDGKIASVEFLRTNPKMIDNEVRTNYQNVWQAYGLMQSRLIGKTRDQAAAVDAVSGATRSSQGWKLSVDRAFERALKVKPAGAVYFDGEHMGVDPEGKYAVYVTYAANQLTSVKVYPMNAAGSFIEEKAYTAAQTAAIAAITPELLANGTAAKATAGMEADFKAAVNAFWDAQQNATIDNNPKYVDGFYSSYGTARSVGVERADVVIRNGKLVDVKLFRLGTNLIDRGTTAYAEVVKANAPMTAKFLANGSYIANYNEKVDGISGATESSEGWNQSIERAFEKALKVPTAGQYFDGKFAGVDTQSKIFLLVDIASDKVTDVKVSLFGADKKLIADDKLTPSQKAFVDQTTAGLIQDGVNMADIADQSELSAAAKAALTDALASASKQQGQYKDGTFTAFGGAYDKGTNRADVTLRNGKIVNIALFRIGMNLVDLGAKAHAEVVAGIPVLTAKFLADGTREGAQTVDAISGATNSSNGFKAAIDYAYGKAEIVETNKAAFFNGVFIGVSKDKFVNVMVTVKNGVPVSMTVYYLDGAGKTRTVESLTAAEKAVKNEIEGKNVGTMHKYAYKPTAFGSNDDEKAVSARAVEAIKAALEAAGK